MMNDDIYRVSLGVEGLAYVRAQLMGGHTLSRCLLLHCSEFQQAYTLVPHGIDRASLTDFESGGKLPGGTPERNLSTVRIPNTNAALSRIIREHLSAGTRNACIFENAVAQQDYPYVAGLTGIFFFGREVYHYVLSSDARDDDVESTIKSARSIPQFVGVLTRCSVGRAHLERASVSLDLLQELSREARAIIAGAYDGESYIIAER